MVEQDRLKQYWNESTFLQGTTGKQLSSGSNYSWKPELAIPTLFGFFSPNPEA